MAGRQMRRLGQLIRQAEHSGPGAVDIGHTIADPSGGWVDVDIAGAIVPCRVPGSFRTTVRVDQDVRVSRSGGVRTVTEIITALPAPAVAATPAASAVDPDVPSTTSSGLYDYTIGDGDWNAVRAYTRDGATVSRGLAGDVNELRTDYAVAASDIVLLRNTVNSLCTTVEQLRAALANQGHVT